MPMLLAALLLAVLPTYRLVDSVGEPVRDATVQVAGASTVSRTDEQGRDGVAVTLHEVSCCAPAGSITVSITFLVHASSSSSRGGPPCDPESGRGTSIVRNPGLTTLFG